MKANNYGPVSIFTGIFMLLALLWLTVGSSFVYIDQLQHKKVSATKSSQDTPQSPDENTCPFDDDDETPETCNNTWAAEYLRADQEDLVYSAIQLHDHKSHYKTAFIFFHLESFSPPPDPLS
jgi:hypothetical protein